MQCRMAGCQRIATETWKLVDVCCHCWDAIQSEQHKYYSRRITDKERFLNAQIEKIKEADERKAKEIKAVITKSKNGLVTQVEIDGRHYNLVKEAAK